MISIATGAVGNPCCFCSRNKTKNPIPTANCYQLDHKKHSASEANINNFVILANSRGGRRKARWWWWCCCNDIFPLQTATGKGGNIFVASGTAALMLMMMMMMMMMMFSGTAVVAATFDQTLDDTLSNVPQTLSGEDENKKARIQHPKSRSAERCTVKCVTTCIRGGAGSPGEGPLNVRGPLVVFKDGFRSRHYCLVECSDICNLIKEGEDGP